MRRPSPLLLVGEERVRTFTVIDSYGTFCETAGAGTGSELVVKGTAVLDGNKVTNTILSWTCANGSPGLSTRRGCLGKQQ